MYESEQNKPMESAGEQPESAAAPEETKPRPRIYVASLSDYNAGVLHGVWLDATQDEEELQAGITAMLDASRESVAEGDLPGNAAARQGF